MAPRTIRWGLTAGIGVLVAVPSACGDGAVEALSFSGSTMGTSYDVLVETRGGAVDTPALASVVEEELSYVQSVMSTYEPASDVSRFGARARTDPMPVDASLAEVLVPALEVAERSAGAFDPTVAPLVDAWGFGPPSASTPDSATVAALLESVGHDLLEVDTAASTLRKLDPSVRVDLSGVAKGYAAERVAQRLRGRGYRSALVDVGGELYALGTHLDGRPWRVALEGPGVGAPELIGTVELVDEAVATSGDFRNYYEEGGVRYTHILDPRTGFPVPYRGFSVSVVHSSGALADAWATALTVLGPQEGLKVAESEGLSALFAWRSPDGPLTAPSPRMARRVTLVE